MMRYYLGLLVQKARAGADPGLYADLVLDSVDDETLAAMMARGALLIDDFAAAHPEVSAHRGWFESLIQAVTVAVSGDDADDSTTPPSENANATRPAPIVVPGNAAE